MEAQVDCLVEHPGFHRCGRTVIGFPSIAVATGCRREGGGGGSGRRVGWCIGWRSGGRRRVRRRGRVGWRIGWRIGWCVGRRWRIGWRWRGRRGRRQIIAQRHWFISIAGIGIGERAQVGDAAAVDIHAIDVAILLPEKLTGGGIQHQTGAQRIDRQGQQLHRCAAIPRHAIDAIGPRQVEPPGMTISDQMIDFGIAHPIAALAVDLTAAAAVERNHQDAGVVVGHIELATHRINRQGIIARLRSRTHQGHVTPVQVSAPNRRHLLADRLAPERERSHIRFTPIEFAILGVNCQGTQRLGSGQEGHGVGAIQIGPFDDLLIDPVELVAANL